MMRTVWSLKDIVSYQQRQKLLAPGAGPLGPPPPDRPDDYKSRLLKYIPGEVISLYVTANAALRAAEASASPLHWWVFFFGLVATPLYLWRIAKVRKGLQLAISTLAFAIWVFAMGGPFSTLEWYRPVHGALALPAYTFLVALIEA